MGDAFIDKERILYYGTDPFSGPAGRTGIYCQRFSCWFFGKGSDTAAAIVAPDAPGVFQLLVLWQGK